MSTSSIKRQIRRFHDVVVQWSSKKCTKKRDARAENVVVVALSSLLFHQTNIRHSAVIGAQAFLVAQNVPKWEQSVNKRSFSHGTVCTNKFKYLLEDPFSWSPSLEKWPHKVTEGGSFDPHWPISRINPENVAFHTQWSLLIISVQLVISTFGDCLRGNMERERKTAYGATIIIRVTYNFLLVISRWSLTNNRSCRVNKRSNFKGQNLKLSLPSVYECQIENSLRMAWDDMSSRVWIKTVCLCVTYTYNDCFLNNRSTIYKLIQVA